VAAVYLAALTGDASYHDVVSRRYPATRPMQEDRWSSYDPEVGDALLFYASLPGANAEVKAAVTKRKLEQARGVEIYGFRPELDLYRAYMRDDSYHWGHNMVVANVGNTNYDLLQDGLIRGGDATTFVDRAEGLLHHFH